MQSDIVKQLGNVVNLYKIPFGWRILGAVAQFAVPEQRVALRNLA